MKKKILLFLILITLSTLFALSKGPTDFHRYDYHNFSSLHEAVIFILKKSDPLVVGFGEYHQVDNGEDIKITSTISRFSRMISTVSGRATDLIVETWVFDGSCLEEQNEIASEVEEIIDRPQETKSELVKLIEKAKILRVHPHILNMPCEKYESLRDSSGSIDNYALLELVTDQIIEKYGEIKKVRDEEDNRLASQEKLILLYGGALHNDLFPDEGWEFASYANKMAEITEDRFTEIDLYVPEFIKGDEELHKKGWHKSYKKHLKNCNSSYMVIERSDKSYIIILQQSHK